MDTSTLPDARRATAPTSAPFEEARRRLPEIASTRTVSLWLTKTQTCGGVGIFRDAPRLGLYMTSLRLALISATLMLAIGCGDYSSSSPYSPSPTPSAPPQAAPQGSSSVMIPVGAEFLGNRAYVP